MKRLDLDLKSEHFNVKQKAPGPQMGHVEGGTPVSPTFSGYVIGSLWGFCPCR